MSWLRLALGLIREAATTDVGQGIINDIRENAFGKRRESGQAEDVNEWRRLVEERITVIDRNMEMLVGMLNAQDENLVKIQKRQRIWNLCLLGGIVVAIVVAYFL